MSTASLQTYEPVLRTPSPALRALERALRTWVPGLVLFLLCVFVAGCSTGDDSGLAGSLQIRDTDWCHIDCNSGGLHYMVNFSPTYADRARAIIQKARAVAGNKLLRDDKDKGPGLQEASILLYRSAGQDATLVCALDFWPGQTPQIIRLIIPARGWVYLHDKELANELNRLFREAPHDVAALVDALETLDAEGRRMAADVLGQNGKKAAKAIPALIKASADENSWVAVRSAEALLKVDPASVDSVLAAVTKVFESEDADVRLLAVELVCKLGEKGKAALPLLERGLSDRSGQVRRASATALREMRANPQQR